MKTYKVNELVEGVEYRSGVGNVYKIHKGRLCVLSDYHDGWTESYNSYNAVFDMVFTEHEPMKDDFKPIKGENYYYLDFIVRQETWNDDVVDNTLKSTVGVYRTEEQVKQQAKEKAKELGWI